MDMVTASTLLTDGIQAKDEVGYSSTSKKHKKKHSSSENKEKSGKEIVHHYKMTKTITHEGEFTSRAESNNISDAQKEVAVEANKDKSCCCFGFFKLGGRK